MVSRGAASIGQLPHLSRNPSVSSASSVSWAKPTSPTSSTSNSNEVTMPKFAPAPRTAQNRSGFSVLGGPHDRAVGQHHLDRAQAVDGQAVLAGQQADPARRGEPADAHAAVVARAERPAVAAQRVRRRRSSARRGRSAPGGCARRAPRSVQRADVDHHAAVVRGPPADAVAAAADARAAARRWSRAKATRRPPRRRSAAAAPARVSRRAGRSRDPRVVGVARLDRPLGQGAGRLS